MLPDLPKFKADVEVILRSRFEARARAEAGFVSTIHSTTLFEGDAWVIERPGRPSEKSRTRGVGAGFKIMDAEVGRLTLKDVVERLDRAAERMAKRKARWFYRALSEDLERHGRTQRGGGKPLDAEAVIRAFESLECSFDEKGEPAGLSIVVGPAMADRLKAVFEEIMKSPELAARLRRIRDEQFERWRLREADRRLVG